MIVDLTDEEIKTIKTQKATKWEFWLTIILISSFYILSQIFYEHEGISNGLKIGAIIGFTAIYPRFHTSKRFESIIKKLP